MRVSDDLSISIVKASELSPRLREEILAVCSRAYEVDFRGYLEQLDPATHVLAHLGAELVSHAAWIDRTLRAEDIGPLRSAYIEAVVTVPEHQRKGFGSAVLKAIPPLLSRYDIAALSPAEREYYERLGWVLWQGPLAYVQGSNLIETPEDEVMIYRLPRTPRTLNLNARLVTDWRPGEVW